MYFAFAKQDHWLWEIYFADNPATHVSEADGVELVTRAAPDVDAERIVEANFSMILPVFGRRVDREERWSALRLRSDRVGQSHPRLFRKNLSIACFQ